ncbi:MAG: hypothetical protein F4Y25_01975 [Chloroflexi bacterium]|nr:hypothetical protein [Chloroflexota bacterium]
MTVTDLLTRANKYTAMVLPPATAGTIAALIAYYAMEVGGIWKSPDVSWGGFVPGWLFGIFFTMLAAVCFAYLSYQKTRQHPATANMAAIAGAVTILALTWWPTRQCDMVGGVAAGLTAAGMVAALSAIILLARKVLQNTGTDRDDSNDRSDAKSDEAYVGIIPFVQIALALIMVLVAYMAMTNEDLSGSRTKLLAFAGIGITAASSISPKLSLKTILAAAGAVISVIGAFIEADQALTESNSEVGIWTILIVAGIVAGLLIRSLPFRYHIAVQIFVVPAIAGVMAASMASTAALMPAVFISTGCNLPETWGIVSILVAAAAGLIVGFGTLVGTAAIGIRSWWTMRAARSTSRGCQS